MSRTVKSSSELQSLPAYELCYEEYLNDINSAGIVFKHKKSGARVCVISNADNNKTFAIGFRTPVTDSTGVPHIIEHSVLCGSDKYPIKDPFMELAKGSLNTFLNAMTYPDKTVYPVASCNDQDFKNLMGVYMDAVLHPLIYKREEIFRQEGWRYELESADAELKYNGVVYSEMKGAMSSPERLLFEYALEALAPDVTYGYNSGGDPAVIPELSYEQFLAFHSRYYHPSNSYIYLYGDIDVEERLEWLDKEYLCNYDSIDPDSEIKLQSADSCIKDSVRYYPLGKEEDEKNKDYLFAGYVTGDACEILENEALSIVFEILFSKQGAVVKQALLDAGIGEDVFADVEGSMRQPFAYVAAKNTDCAKKQEFIDIIENTIREEIAKGFNKKSILASINSREFAYREADSGRLPTGMVYMDSVLDSWLYDDGRAFAGLHNGDVYASLREKLETDYFERLTEERFLKTTHKTVLSLLPKKGLTEESEKAVADKLAAYKASLSEDEINKLVEKTAALRKFQETPDSAEDLATVPMLSRADMEKKVRGVSNIEKTIDDCKVVLHDYESKGIAYIDLCFNLKGLEEEKISYVELLSRLLCTLSTDKYSYSELDDELCLITGSASFSLVGFISYPDFNYAPMLDFRTKLFYKNIDRCLELAANVIEKTDFSDEKRIFELLNKIRSGLQMSLSNAGHSAAIRRCSSYFSQKGVVDEKSGGIDFYRFIDDLIKNYDSKKAEIKATLEELQKNIFSRENLVVSITAEPEGYEVFAKALPGLLTVLADSSKYGKGDYPCYSYNKPNEAFYTAGMVTYSAMRSSFLGKFDVKGSMKALNNMLSHNYLYPNIRVKGGAYGAFCSLYSEYGEAMFATYRDPKVRESYEVFENAYKFVEEFDGDETELTKAIIGSISIDETPMSAKMLGDRSFTSYMTGFGIELSQKSRDELLAVSAEDIRSLAPFVKYVTENAVRCTIGSESIIKANEELFSNIEPLF